MSSQKKPGHQTRRAKTLKPKGKGRRRNAPGAPTQSPTPSTPSTEGAPVEGVEGVEGESNKRLEHEWQMEEGLDRNFRRVGRLLASLGLSLFAHSDGGLLQIRDGKVRRIGSAREVAPLIIDNIRIRVTKNGKYHGEKVADGTLNNMLLSRHFLGNFQMVQEVVTTPIVLADYTWSQPGYNPQGGVLYLGPAVVCAGGLDTINQFLDVMEWASSADRTNAVAAALTVLFRYHFPGGKPMVLLTATKSHAGKGTVIEFLRGITAKAELLYEAIDWPMQRSLQEQLIQHPEIGVVNIDNVRIDSAGRARIIRSGFLESFVTSTEIMLNSATVRKPVHTANKYVILLNTNEGSLSIDLLNRSLPIRLAPTGDVTERRSPIGNPKLEFLPTHRQEIEAELCGMIERWRQAGTPLDESVGHYPMSVWAKTIGGILQVNGFKDFLGNYSSTRAAADPIREALSILAFHSGNSPQRARDLAKLTIDQGLNNCQPPPESVSSGREVGHQSVRPMVVDLGQGMPTQRSL